MEEKSELNKNEAPVLRTLDIPGKTRDGVVEDILDAPIGVPRHRGSGAIIFSSKWLRSRTSCTASRQKYWFVPLVNFSSLITLIAFLF